MPRQVAGALPTGRQTQYGHYYFIMARKRTPSAETILRGKSREAARGRGKPVPRVQCADYGVWRMASRTGSRPAVASARESGARISGTRKSCSAFSWEPHHFDVNRT